MRLTSVAARPLGGRLTIIEDTLQRANCPETLRRGRRSPADAPAPHADPGLAPLQRSVTAADGLIVSGRSDRGELIKPESAERHQRPVSPKNGHSSPMPAMTAKGRKRHLKFFGSGRSNPKHRSYLHQTASGRLGREPATHEVLAVGPLGVETVRSQYPDSRRSRNGKAVAQYSRYMQYEAHSICSMIESNPGRPLF